MTMSLKSLGIAVAVMVLAFLCYRVGYESAEAKGESALNEFKLQQAQAVIEAQLKAKANYDAKLQAIINSHNAERSVYDQRLRQLEKFRSAGASLATCTSERDRLAKLAIRGERLLRRAESYLNACE